MKRTAPIISSHSSQTQIREIRNPSPGQPPASLLGYVLLSLLIITGVTASLAQEKIRVGISNFSSSYAPIFVAKKRRFYSDEGLGVEIILLRGLLGTQALIGGSVDFASASNPNASVKGARLKATFSFCLQR